jgi:hypothetical protein
LFAGFGRRRIGLKNDPWQPTITANWNAADGSKYVVPLGGGIGRIMKLGAQPVNIGAQVYGNPGSSARRITMVVTLAVHNAFSEITESIAEPLRSAPISQ